LCPLAVKVGEAEGPIPVTALAHDQIKPVAVRMNASLQQFNLVRIECHFNVPVPLTVADASLVTIGRSKIDLFGCMTVTDTLKTESRVSLSIFRQKRPVFDEVRRH
jgi:hypothetical protein